MNILTVSKLKKEFSGDVLFENVSFDINSGDKIAVIGKNGTGKSTLLKMILGEYVADDGDIHKNKQATIGYLSQTVIEQEENTLEEEMLLVFSNLLIIEEKLAELIASKIKVKKSLVKKQKKQEKKKQLMGGGYGSGGVVSGMKMEGPITKNPKSKVIIKEKEFKTENKAKPAPAEKKKLLDSIRKSMKKDFLPPTLNQLKRQKQQQIQEPS